MNLSGIPIFSSILEQGGYNLDFFSWPTQCFLCSGILMSQLQTKETEMQLLWNVLINYIYFT